MKILKLFIFIVLVGANFCSFAVMRDPTKPTAYVFRGGAADFTAGLQLTSVLNSTHRKVATINGKPLMIGDEINGFDVTAIKSGSVELRSASHSVILHLFNAVKKCRV